MADEKKRILIIDDDPAICRGIRRLLEEEGLYEVDEVHNSSEALDKIGQFSPQLVILDIKMPGVGGYELCSNLREDKKYQGLKIIGISGISGGIGKTFISVLGADYYFEKPFDEVKLKKKIALLLQKPEANP